jgi:oxygen-dependent protoporphyrinogen oxidase
MIAIVGGGISGLTLAHYLAVRNRPFILLEASERVGGVIRSGRVDGHLLEWGPQRTRLTTEFAALVDELQLPDQLITAPRHLPLFVYRAGKLRRVPFTPAAFIASDILSWRGKLRLLLEPFTGAARDDEPVADYFRRKIGAEAYENIAGPLYGGLYASDPQHMLVGLSLGHVLREFNVQRSMLLPLLRRGGTVAPPDACSFRDGLEVLPRALHGRHRAHVRLRAPVNSIAANATGYTLVAGDDAYDASAVVITTPADATAQLLSGVAADVATRVAQLHYNPLAVVHLHADTSLQGLGYQVSFAESLITRGVTFNDSLFGRNGVYTAYLGGAKNPWIAAESPESVARIALEEFRMVTGYDARVLSVAQERMPAWDGSWAALSGMSLPRGVHVHTNWYARPGIPGRLAMARRLSATL